MSWEQPDHTYLPPSFESDLDLRAPDRGGTRLSEGGDLLKRPWHRAWWFIGLISPAALTRWEMPSSWLVRSPWIVIFWRHFTLKFQTKWLQ